MLPRVFDLFTQIDHTLGRSHGGLGIGLALVRRLVEMHGGRVRVRSDGPGTGSEFLVRLPLVTAAAPHDIASPSADRLPASPPTRRILIVDDNRDAAESLGLLLRLLGAETAVVNDGVSAVERVRSFHPDLVLLDLGMPGMDGHEVARRIRADNGNSSVLLIALTGWGQPEDRRRSREAGFDHHLVKPVDFEALQSLLRSIELQREPEPS